jgi:RHS repeat-associated protein
MFTLKRHIAFIFLLLVGWGSAFAQKKDSTVTKTNEAVFTPMSIVCTVDGPTTVHQGSSISYGLACETEVSATSWDVTGGTIIDWGPFYVGITWNYGVSQGVIKAKSGGGAIGTLSVTVIPPIPLSAGSISNPSQTINYNTTPALLQSSQAVAGNCNSNYSYQWQSSTNNVNFNDIGGASQNNYQPGNLTTTTYFRKRAICNAEVAYTNTATVTVIPQIVVGNLVPGSQTVNYAADAGYIYTPGVTGGNGTYSYQWQRSPDNSFSNPVNIPGQTLDNYTPKALTQTTWYRLLVTSNGASVASNPVVVNVYPPLQPGTVSPATQPAIDFGSSAQTLRVTGVTGGSGSYFYQWQQANNSSFLNPVTISNTNSTIYTPTNCTATSWYRVAVNSNGVTAYSNAVVVSVYAGPVNVQNLNYIRIRSFELPGITNLQAADAVTNVAEVKQATDYFDGLGRKMQTVAKGGSKNGTNFADLVAPVVYDEFGREAIKYLPYPSPTSDGNFKPAPVKELSDFYKLTEPNESVYYGQTVFESSPANRVFKNMAPGDSWAGSGRGIENKFYFNSPTDNVRVWNVTDVPNGLGTYYNAAGQAGVYPAASLYKSITVDENGAQVIEFKDKDGLVVLKKVQLTAAPDNGSGSGYAGWLCTSYIYDDLNNLRCVVQPRGVELLIQNGWDLSALNGDILGEQCFRYEYDYKNRMIMKKMPGAGIVYIVYDKQDRVVMTQDAKLRGQGTWLVTGYDNLNRPVTSGLWNSAVSFTDHLSNAAVSDNYPSSAMLVAGYDLLTETHYDDYNNLPAGLTSTLDNNWSNNFISSYNTAPDYAQEMTQSQSVKGMVTWTRVKVLGSSSQVLPSVNIYDKYNRVIQVKSVNQTGQTDIVSSQYDFAGKQLRTAIKQQKSAPNALTTYLYTRNTYDELGRRTKTENKVNSNDWKVIATTDYDALSRLKHKTLGTKPGTTTDPLETLTNDYNIRGWLLGVNRDYMGQNPSASYFGYELGYDKQINNVNQNFTGVQYNGNISGVVWKSKGDGIERKYDFSYDAVNRLLKADFIQHNTDGSWGKNEVNYDVKMGDGISSASAYDANGNIKRMQQWGLKAFVAAQIDDLNYDYRKNSTGTQVSNKLYKVSDVFTDPNTKLGDFKDGNNADDDYDYDENGNLVKDQNKGIGNIEYNHLNLPRLVTIPGKGIIEYTYDATGNKLQKVVTEGDLTTTTKYIMGFSYETRAHTVPATDDYADKQLYIPQEEGRIRWVPEDQQYYYDYFVKDHLGNVRMVLTEEQKTAVYQAGMEDANRTFEVALFGNKVSTTVTDKPGGFDQVNTNGKISAVNGITAESRIGPGVVLKVMAGDKIKAQTFAWYQPTGMDNTTDPGLPGIISNLLGQLVPGIAGAAKGALASQITNSTVQPGMESFLQGQNQGNGAPKAYLNWVLLDDERFKLVNGSSGFVPVPVISGTQPRALLQANGGNEVEITKNGYIYVYVSNESRGDVYFDDIHVDHIRGPLSEETHYYPFGLTMAGISSKALNFGEPENKKKYNGIEKEDGLGIEIYDANLRELDPQIGRWWEIDPKVDNMEMWSPYASNYDNPIRYSDPLGDEGDDANECCMGLKKVFASISGAVIGTIDNNIPGSNVRGVVASSGIIQDPEVAESWNHALDVADEAGIVQGVGEGTAGGGILTSSVAVTAGTGGFSIEVTGPTAALGAGMFAHGAFVTTKSAGNLASQNGRVNVSSSSNSSTSSSSSSSTSGNNGGRNGKQAKLREIKNDPKTSSADRGWLKQDQNAIDRGNRSTLRVPPGKNLAHERGKEARKGFSYKNSKLQDIDLHKTQHRIEREIRNN